MKSLVYYRVMLGILTSVLKTCIKWCVRIFNHTTLIVIPLWDRCDSNNTTSFRLSCKSLVQKKSSLFALQPSFESRGRLWGSYVTSTQACALKSRLLILSFYNSLECVLCCCTAWLTLASSLSLYSNPCSSPISVADSFFL